eukprot:3941403-Rhodomonas_salina.3
MRARTTASRNGGAVPFWNKICSTHGSSLPGHAIPDVSARLNAQPMRENGSLISGGGTRGRGGVDVEQIDRQPEPPDVGVEDRPGRHRSKATSVRDSAKWFGPTSEGNATRAEPRRAPSQRHPDTLWARCA